MIALFLSSIALGAAGAVVLREMAAIQAKQLTALRPVRIQCAERSAQRRG